MDDPPLHIAVLQGNTLLMGFNQESLGAALQRAQGEPVRLGAAMDQIIQSIPAGAQVQIGFVMPPSLKSMMSAMGGSGAPGAGDPAAANPMAAMMGGLSDIRSVALGVELAEGMALALSGDLGKPDAAAGLAMMLGLMKGQLQAGLAQGIGKKPQDIPADTFAVSAEGRLLSVRLALSAEMLAAAAAQHTAPKQESAQP
jgi:hypothetical protein